MHSTLKPKRAISTKNFAREAKESYLNSKTYALIEFPPVLICSCVCSPLVFGVHADFGLEQFGSFWIFSGAQLCLASSKFVVFIAHINQKAANVKTISQTILQPCLKTNNIKMHHISTATTITNVYNTIFKLVSLKIALTSYSPGTCQ